MADFLTHLFLPLTAAYVLRRDVFDSPAHLSLGAVGLLSDFDKFLGVPGLLHSLVTLVPIAAVLVLLEWGYRGELTYAPVAVALLLSHPLLDVLDGGPAPLLFPFLTSGIGFEYPARTAFGEGVLGLVLEGPLVRLRMASPRPGYNTYGFIDGLGVANALLFLTVYVGLETGRGDR